MFDFEFPNPAFPDATEQQKWEQARLIRDRLLAASDWTQVADAPVDSAAWAVYRQALRDIPQDYETTGSIVWPTPPS